MKIAHFTQCISSYLLIILFSMTVYSCLDVAQDRAQIETRIGTASYKNFTIKIEDGLGSIRTIEAFNQTLKVKLWLQAPHVNIAITHQGDTHNYKELELEIYNVMSNANINIYPAELQNKMSDTFKSHTRRILHIPLLHDSLDMSIIPPQPTKDLPWRFALFADVQERLNGLSDLLIPLGKEDIQFALISGDLTSQGTREDLLTFQKKMNQHLGFPCYATLGNHELGRPGPPFYKVFGRGSFNFDYGDVRFTLLDSASATLAPMIRTKLKSWLKTVPYTLQTVTMHIPLLDPDGTRGGAFANRLEAMEILSELKQGGVDLLMFGHIHTYRSFYQAGINAVISGGGGSIPMKLDGIGRHYVVFEIDAQRRSIAQAVRQIQPAN